jgi:(R,R)-butanediol dehydrogenase/meso-butanediol dehydrogenase/diacetyl reductase
MTPSRVRAAIYQGSGHITVEDRPRPTPTAGEVLVEVSHCGICGSDVHLMLDDWGPTGVVQGHEYSGTVVELGDDTSGWQVGDPVVGGPSPQCGSCAACRANQPSQCARRGEDGAEAGHGEPGGFATHVLVDQRALRAVPDGLPLRVAALAEPLAVSLHAITRSALRPQERALVLGAGPIGALIVAALRARGYGQVGVVEPAPARRLLARELRADPVLTPDALPETSPFSPEQIAGDGVEVVFECSGRRSAMEAGLGMLRRGGRLVLVGAGIEAPRFDPNRILLNELTVTGAFCYDHDGIETALDLLASPGSLPLDLLIEPDDVPLDGLSGALRKLAEGTVAGKALVAPTEGAEGAP